MSLAAAPSERDNGSSFKIFVQVTATQLRCSSLSFFFPSLSFQPSSTALEGNSIPPKRSCEFVPEADVITEAYSKCMKYLSRFKACKESLK